MPAAMPALAQPPSPAFQQTALTGPLPLSAYPRPKNDNGLGIHWSTNLYAQDDEVTDYFIGELKAMNIKWVKLLSDGTDGRHYTYMIEQLVANDIMPIIRLYSYCNDALDLGALGHMVDYFLPIGVYYYELYNEPDIPGVDGGWCYKDGTPDPELLARLWAPAAREVQARGGYPSLPSIFPIGKNVEGWQNSFFQRFLRAVKANGDTAILYQSWGAVHNYSINHPPNYPLDEVNLTGQPLTAAEIARYKLDEHKAFSINQARAKQFEPGGFYVGSDPRLDVTGFLQFIGFHDQFMEIFGFEIPLISTEGGATVGSCEDPRYPCVNEQLQMEWTLAAYDYMLDDAPDYYFATNTWLLAQRALDFWGGTVWESNAWYHDRNGDHLPIVNALKNHPRKHDVRGGNKQAAAPASAETGAQNPPCAAAPPNPCNAAFASLAVNRETIAELSTLGTLTRYPHPPNDNGRGVHYSATIMAQPPEMVDFFVAELKAMNIKWVKIMQGDIPKVEHVYLVEQLVANGIEPIVRVYKPYNEPYEYLADLVTKAKPMGVNYFELYNEPNIAGFPGGWRDGEEISVARILDLWIPAAAAISRAGGYPGLPTLTPGGSYEDKRFLREFLDGLIARKQANLVERAWLPLHNYFLNHPFDYPADPVNLHNTPLNPAEAAARGLTPAQVDAINTARATARLPGGYYVGDTVHQDSNGFKKFEAYAKIFYDRFGFYIPIITTEGGPLVGDNQDPRYPPVNEDDLTTLTVQAYHYILDEAPPYYFAFSPWLLANSAGGHWDAAWEAAAWYRLDHTNRPVVDALKTDPRRLEARRYSLKKEEPAPQPVAQATPVNREPTVEIISVSGPGAPWQVSQAKWQPSATPYPRLRVNVVDAGGNQLAGQQLRVEWSGGWTVLVTQPGQPISMPIAAPQDTYTIKMAGGSGQGIRASGADGLDLTATFLPAGQ
jgi:hypothetical protein